ncbi:MAG TPA: metallophosphatase [Pyrinomonadaceae bacterium]|nr:metallophosphatase [Pyrinomonadaceae bacterium]
MITRRKFLGATLVGASLPLAFSRLLPSAEGFALLPPACSWAEMAEPLIRAKDGETLVTVLNTNDLHSQIDPLPANDRNAGKGGMARMATLVKRVRGENPNTLVVFAGDAFQGTPYFNLYGGEVEYKTMSAVGFDVAVLGNHDFDNGMEGLAKVIPYAKFDIVATNYDVRGTILEKHVKPYVVRRFGDVRVGVFGLGIKLEGLNPPETFAGLKYQDPVAAARGAVQLLRTQEKCNMVVCCSHLGYYPEPKGDELGDTQVVAQVDGIDFIASGHTHTFMRKPVLARQPSGKDTVVFQVGKSGIYVGRVDFTVRANRVTASAGRLLDLRDAA